MEKKRSVYWYLVLISTILIISKPITVFSQADDDPYATYKETWSKVQKYLDDANIKLYFVNWDDIRFEREVGDSDVYSGTGTITLELIKVNLEEALRAFNGNKNLAVVTISHSYYDNYVADRNQDFAKLEKIIKKYGFKKVVFISEAAMGPGSILRE
ncbi:hypothetical protein ACFL38_02260 [Candidatus Omnitrophota bacterium]